VPSIVKSSWFGRQVSVLLISGKSLTGELTEVSDHYIVLTTKTDETQIMAHAIIAIRPAEQAQQEPS
jgi:sRNA-binding regulator protein Hfq